MTERASAFEDCDSASPLRTITMDFRPQGRRKAARRAEREKNLKFKHPASAARLLAMAYYIQEQLDAGVYSDYADVANEHGFTRARLTQIMNLLLLSPTIQEAVLNMTVCPGREPITERHLRKVLRTMIWSEQEKIWGRIAGQKTSS